MLVAVLTVVLLALWVWRSTRRPAWCPAGPPLLPVFGNLLSMNLSRQHVSLSEWARRYGGLYHLRLGVLDMVVLSDPALIREALGRSEVAGRPRTALFQWLIEGKGLASSEGDLYTMSRRLTLRHLKNLGMGRSSMEEYINRQVHAHMTEFLEPNCGSEIQLDGSLNIAILNVIWKLVASQELRITDTKVFDTITTMMGLLEHAKVLEMLDALPLLKILLPRFVFQLDQKESKFRKHMDTVFIPMLKRHRAVLDQDAPPRDFTEAFLQEQARRPGLISDWHILMSVLDLFLAGSDTSSSTLRWAVCLLCSRPDCQRRLQAEIDAVVGRLRPPALADREHMPYTEAVLLETQRLGDVAAVALPHCTMAPVTIGGYRVPAGVTVMANLHSVHHSHSLFQGPGEFRPERFLDDAGRFVPNRNVMPFSVGKRQCMGESLARANIFLFLTGWLQHYSFRWPEGFQHDFSEDLENTFMRAPRPYKIIPIRR